MAKKLQPPLDQGTFNRVYAVMASARLNGVDTIEALHQAELLLTPARRQELEVAILVRFAEQLELFRPVEFLRIVNRSGESSSPADMQRAIRTFLDMFIETVKQEET